MKKSFIAWIIMGWIMASTALAGEPIKFGVAAMISPADTIIYYQRLIDYVGNKLGRPVNGPKEKL